VIGVPTTPEGVISKVMLGSMNGDLYCPALAAKPPVGKPPEILVLSFTVDVDVFGVPSVPKIPPGVVAGVG
jgi:hypothetical protein